MKLLRDVILAIFIFLSLNKSIDVLAEEQRSLGKLGSNYSHHIPDPMCGANCLWQIAHLFGKKYTISEVAGMCHVEENTGSSMKNLVDCAKSMGFNAIAAKTNLDELLNNQSCIAILLLHLNYDKKDFGHFVVFDSKNNNTVRVLDGQSIRDIDLKSFNSVWKGYTVFIGLTSGNFEFNQSFNSNKVLNNKRFTMLIPLVIVIIVTLVGVTFFYYYRAKPKRSLGAENAKIY